MDFFKFLEKWGALGMIAFAGIFHFADKLSMRERCMETHRELEIREDAKYNELKDSLTEVKITLGKITQKLGIED